MREIDRICVSWGFCLLLLCPGFARPQTNPEPDQSAIHRLLLSFEALVEEERETLPSSSRAGWKTQDVLAALNSKTHPKVIELLKPIIDAYPSNLCTLRAYEELSGAYAALVLLRHIQIAISRMGVAESKGL